MLSHARTCVVQFFYGSGVLWGGGEIFEKVLRNLKFGVGWGKFLGFLILGFLVAERVKNGVAE